MIKASLPKLQQKLIRGGVSRSHVQRLLQELTDHHQALYEEARLQGNSCAAAQALADRALGDYNDIADHMLADPRLKSFGFRHPWLLMLAAPLLSFTLAIAALVLIVVGVASFFYPESPDLGVPEVPLLFQQFVFAYSKFVMYVLPVLLAGLFTAYGMRNGVSRKVLCLGIFLFCVCSSAMTLWIEFPVAGTDRVEGVLGVSFGYGLMFNYEQSYWLGFGDNKLRLLFTLALVGWYARMQQRKLNTLEAQ